MQLSAMPDTVSLKSLHLEYRLWIAELNYDITLIRIFNDRLTEIMKSEGQKAKEADRLNKKLNAIRESIDGLSHRMQIEKMSTAAMARQHPELDYRINLPPNHSGIREDFFKFRISFNEMTKEFLNHVNEG